MKLIALFMVVFFAATVLGGFLVQDHYEHTFVQYEQSELYRDLIRRGDLRTVVPGDTYQDNRYQVTFKSDRRSVSSIVMKSSDTDLEFILDSRGIVREVIQYLDSNHQSMVRNIIDDHFIGDRTQITASGCQKLPTDTLDYDLMIWRPGTDFQRQAQSQVDWALSRGRIGQ